MWESLPHMKSKFTKVPAAFPHTEFPTHRQLWLRQGNPRLCHSSSTSQQGICALMVFSPTLSHQNLLLGLSSEPVKRTESSIHIQTSWLWNSVSMFLSLFNCNLRLHLTFLSFYCHMLLAMLISSPSCIPVSLSILQRYVFLMVADLANYSTPILFLYQWIPGSNGTKPYYR